MRVVAGLVMACALAGSAMLALVRSGDPTSRRLIEVVSLTPAGLPAAVVAATIALALLVRSPRRLLPGLALLLALALAAVHGAWLAPLYVPQVRTAGGEPALVVMSLNVETADTARLAEVVADRDVDVLVLLEVTGPRLAELRAAGITRMLPHLAGATTRESSGTVVLSRLPVTEDVPVQPGAESRLVRLEAPGPEWGEGLTVVAVHTRPPYLPDLWRSDHAQLADRLTRLEAGGPVLLAGDFNATLAHVPMRRILGLGYVDAADQVGAGWSPSWPTGGHLRRFGLDVPPFAAIDHVLTGPGLVVTRAETFDAAGADHRAVLATVSVAPR